MIRIARGNCLVVLPQLAPGSIDMVFADLPYGVTRNTWDSVIPFVPLWEQLLRVGKKNAAFVFTATQPFATALINSRPKMFRYDLIWQKGKVTGFLNARHSPLRAHEHCLIFSRMRTAYNAQMTDATTNYGTTRRRRESTNWGVMNKSTVTIDGGKRFPVSLITGIPCVAGQHIVHPTQKPVALLEWLIKTYSHPGDTVLDPTMGSGTTGVACVNTGRQFFGIELDKTYYHTAKKRIREALP